MFPEEPKKAKINRHGKKYMINFAKKIVLKGTVHVLSSEPPLI